MRKYAAVAALSALSLMASLLSGSAQARTGAAAPSKEPSDTSAPAKAPPPHVPLKDRPEALGKDWRDSRDRIWTTHGDADGFHILTASESTGYQWRTAASLSEPGFPTDRWIGNACLSGAGGTLVVTYAPRGFTNETKLFDRGAFTALVGLDDGAVTKLPISSSLAYFSPSCGAGDQAVITQGGGTKLDATRLLRVDTAEGTVADPIEVAGQLTSATPTPDGIVAADSGGLVRVAKDGTRTALAATNGVPFQLHTDADGGVVFMDRKDNTATVRRLGAGAARAAGTGLARTTKLGTGRLDKVGITTGAPGKVYLTGELTTEGALPSAVTKLDAPKTTRVSSTGDALITKARSLGRTHPAAPTDPSVLTEPVRLSMTVRSTDSVLDFTVTPSAATSAGARRHPMLRSPSSPTTKATGSPHDPVEAERTCSVPRNDPHNQAMQPKPRQVEWAVDQAITDSLYVQRPANWKNLGMPSYTPQGLFPPLELEGGGRVPAQIFLGVIAQESNMWQAPGSVVPGVTGSPLIGNYYGQNFYNDDDSDDWVIDFSDADCGYGVSQVTDGMRLAGREGDRPSAMPYDKQRAVALDFAANVAAGLRILQKKWNVTRRAGLTINNGDPAKIENWFYAVWAYNSGFHPKSGTGENNGAWGVGWSNNPVNPNYPANRAAFLEDTYEDAAHPQDWPYPEKVIGWAGHPVEVLEGPNDLVSGYRPAWWNGDGTTGPLHRRTAKPPVEQFCDASNNCHPGESFDPNAPGLEGEPAGPCAHRNAQGEYDLKCWYNEPSTWKPDCDYTCGNELLRFDPGYAYQEDAASYPPNCSRDGLPSNALVVDDQPLDVASVRPDCTRSGNSGTFTLDFASDDSGHYPSKVDFHQLGAGFGGHFWFAHTRTAGLRNNSMEVTGTWRLNQELHQWARVLVHMPDHGAHTQQAQYRVDLGNGITKKRVKLQRTSANRWVSLGAFPFSGTPRVRLSSVTHDGDDGSEPIENEDIAYDAIAFQPLPAKPDHMVVAMGDSYSSGEGGSRKGGVDYYPETDNNGDDRTARNACHRSPYTWSRQSRIPGTPDTIGAMQDIWASRVDYHLLACSHARIRNLLPYYTAPPQDRPTDAWGVTGRQSFGEVSQIDKGFLDEHTTLVTLSIGGNDARFADVMAECVLYAGFKLCQNAHLPNSEITAGEEIPQRIKGPVEDSIVTALKEIHQRAPNAKIMLMGYPRLLEGLGQCVAGIGTEEAPWINEMSALLATHMQEAVDRANTAAGSRHVWFSDPRDDFAGEAVCGDPETIHAIVPGTSSTPGEPSGVTTSQQSFHPKITGYENYAESMNETLRTMGY